MTTIPGRLLSLGEDEEVMRTGLEIKIKIVEKTKRL